ncbi:MAG: hypothetical protein R3A52_11170 [Polyangiales bacterium]
MSAPSPWPSVAGPAQFYRSMEPVPDWPVGREGRNIVFYNGVQLPHACLKCGAPAAVAPRKTLYWHSPWIYMFILPSVLIYAVIALAVRKSAAVNLPLCQHHHARRRRFIAATVAGVVGSLTLPFVLASLSADPDAVGWAAIAMVFGLVASTFLGLFGARVIYPVYIDDRVVKLGGVGEGYLSRCPPVR